MKKIQLILLTIVFGACAFSAINNQSTTSYKFYLNEKLIDIYQDTTVDFISFILDDSDKRSMYFRDISNDTLRTMSDEGEFFDYIDSTKKYEYVHLDTVASVGDITLSLLVNEKAIDSLSFNCLVLGPKKRHRVGSVGIMSVKDVGNYLNEKCKELNNGTLFLYAFQFHKDDGTEYPISGNTLCVVW